MGAIMSANRTFLAFVTLAVAVACRDSSGTEPQAATGLIRLTVDSLPATVAGGLHLWAPDGVTQYSLVRQGSNPIITGAMFGEYRLEFDTVRFGDTGTTTLKYDGSRWTATPISIRLQLDRVNPTHTERIVYRKITGGISVSATGNPDLWVEFLHADGSGCRCTAFSGNGLRVPSSSASVQNLLPGDYQVHFLPITYFKTPSGSGSVYTVIPSPSTVLVTVRAGELAAASTGYTIQ